ncbi:MAG: hypothetical protein UR52_C0002G0102 [Candidatus Gottesmanbacteria bacterium GW2011_GWA1_34_13]|uniref:Prepilin-type N-terminal cleavage/methylation domain-containing protein n=1 Tax=Candidatus Gottesmanbacteria bacterium GW2011_GWA1_34_13 TaxID=1618434 RepID=A0A0G0ASJ8_9BACT|nr:MAG: hypothetical protein UR52_C0002G0102 [Candidatus Gottesmanbacteria bacterium GW2011_GWA1_34_13]
MPKIHNHIQNQGFTLVEVIVAAFIFVVISAGTAIFSVYFLRNYSFSFEENQAVGQAQNTLTTLVREIREARFAEDGAWAITQADDNIFVFYSDVTNDSRPDRIRYFLDGTELKKGVIEPTAVPVTYPTASEKIYIIADNVDNQSTPIFRYYNGNWPSDTTNNPLTVGQRILNTRLVKIYIRININSNTGALPFEMTEDVQIRSLKDNL